MFNKDDVAAAATPPMVLRSQDGVIRPDYLELVIKAIRAADRATLRGLVGSLHEADVGALLERLDPDYRRQLVELMGPDFDFSALVEVDDTVREEILGELPAETVAEGVRELDSDDAVYILEDLPSDERAQILERLPPPERVALVRSLDYPAGSAGRRMQAEFIVVRSTWTIGHTIDYLRSTEALPHRFYELYVVDAAHRLLGTVALDQLLRAKRPVPLSEVMNPDRQRVHAVDDLSAVARLFEHYNLIAAPVVDAQDRLVGVLTVDDIVDVIEEKADEEIKALGGVGDEKFSDSVWRISLSRFNWLLINLVTAFLASAVLDLFQGQLQKMVALAVLAPIVASQGGNAATQTMTVAVRALATRDLGRDNARRIAAREVMVGLLNGLAFAVITGVAASVWFRLPDLGIVIGLAMVCNLLAAALGGILIPLVLDRFRADPAVSSGVFVTTVTDVVGFFSFLGIATLWFGLR
jgi:magnesium transporter